MRSIIAPCFCTVTTPHLCNNMDKVVHQDCQEGDPTPKECHYPKMVFIFLHFIIFVVLSRIHSPPLINQNCQQTIRMKPIPNVLEPQQPEPFLRGDSLSYYIVKAENPHTFDKLPFCAFSCLPQLKLRFNVSRQKRKPMDACNQW